MQFEKLADQDGMVGGWPDGREEEKEGEGNILGVRRANLKFSGRKHRFRPRSWVNNFGNYHRPSCATPSSQRLELRLTGKGTTTFDIAVYIGRYEFQNSSRDQVSKYIYIYRRTKFSSHTFRKFVLDSVVSIRNMRCCKHVRRIDDGFFWREIIRETKFSFSFPPSYYKLSTPFLQNYDSIKRNQSI